MAQYWLKYGNTALGLGQYGLSISALPANTLRLRFTDGVTPNFFKGTAVQISSSPNIWDLTYNNTDWSYLLQEQGDSLIEVIATGDTSSVTNMSQMFTSCRSLTSVPLFDTSSVTNMRKMFSGCDNLASVPLFDTSSVTNMSQMFEGCYSLFSVPLFDTRSVTDMSSMFYECINLTSVPLFDTSSVTNMRFMFSYCTNNLTSIPLFDTSSVTDMDRMFNNCYAVKTGALALYQQASTQITPPYTHYETFRNCGSDTVTGLAELQQIPQSWGGLAPG